VSGPRSVRPAAFRLVDGAVLAALFAIVFGATHLPGSGPRDLGDIAAVGFLLLAGTLASRLLESVGLPHLTAYLAVGVLVGPHVLHLVGPEAVADLMPVNALALSLIALAGGAELRVDGLREGLRGLAWATLLQNLLGFAGAALTFLAARPLLPFTEGLAWPAIVAAALLWGTVATTRSPAAVLGVASQLRPAGALTSFTFNFVMTSDVVVVVLLAIVTSVCRPLVDASVPFSLQTFRELGHELAGSVSLGATLGLALALYLRFVRQGVFLVLVVIGLVLTQAIDYVHLDWLLVFIAAGFVVRNASRQGDALLAAIERTGEIVYVVFFATAGAHLELPLLARLWPVALLLAGVRAALAIGAGRLSSRLADEAPVLRRWGFAGLVSQAGLALGVASAVAREFPAFGAGFGALAIAVVAVNEVAGPILFKAALERAGEAGRAVPQAEAAPARAALDAQRSS
jgi:Kef-type K+ transport system membrane component KefB